MTIKPENRFWIWIYAFAAFILLVAMGVFGWLAWSSREEPGVGRVAGTRPQSSETNALPDEQYELLAAFEAPPYKPGRDAPKAFQLAMVRYAKHEYPAAAAALRTVADAQPEFVDARFYLGISLLLAGDRIAGIQELRALTMAGQGPYLERARFYLAKGLIAEHDVDRARRQLKDVIEQHGDLEKQATALLGQIRPS